MKKKLQRNVFTNLFLARKDFLSPTEYDIQETEMMSGTFPTRIAQPFAIFVRVTELMREVMTK